MANPTKVKDVPSPPFTTLEELETRIFQYVEVLDRTLENNALTCEFVDPEDKALLLADNAILLDIRNRIWRQFATAFVETLN